MRKILTIVLAILVTLISACSDTDANLPRELVRIYGLSATRRGGIGNLRLCALKEAAMTVGAQAGLRWRAEQIDCMLKEQRKTLDDIYKFRSLMLRDHVMPPVLDEGRQAMNLSSCQTIRTADQVFRIVRPPCFVSLAPNWREYLWLRFSKPEDPCTSMLPKNREEAAFWNCFVKKGWDKGIDQANQIFVANLHRLNRDYMGMILYHRLYAQNMVTAPFVSKADLGVTGNGKEMRINDRVLRIAQSAHLNTNSAKWRSAVWPVKIVRMTADDLAALPRNFDELPGPSIVDKHGQMLKLPAPGAHGDRYLMHNPNNPPPPRRLIK